MNFRLSPFAHIRFARFYDARRVSFHFLYPSAHYFMTIRRGQNFSIELLAYEITSPRRVQGNQYPTAMKRKHITENIAPWSFEHR
jgi:hypothetical protein